MCTIDFDLVSLPAQTEYNDPDAVDADMALFGLRTRSGSHDADTDEDRDGEVSLESGGGSLESLGTGGELTGELDGNNAFLRNYAQHGRM